mmetsp:Transcript_26237/g.83054  ORF Transcript_26237/g.83054 Transcript_26237/m.83054 type:complete len:549 (-) Transcript_26237:861-2507(-)
MLCFLLCPAFEPHVFMDLNDIRRTLRGLILYLAPRLLICPANCLRFLLLLLLFCRSLGLLPQFECNLICHSAAVFLPLLRTHLSPVLVLVMFLLLGLRCRLSLSHFRCATPSPRLHQVFSWLDCSLPRLFCCVSPSLCLLLLLLLGLILGVRSGPFRGQSIGRQLGLLICLLCSLSRRLPCLAFSCDHSPPLNFPPCPPIILLFSLLRGLLLGPLVNPILGQAIGLTLVISHHLPFGRPLRRQSRSLFLFGLLLGLLLVDRSLSRPLCPALNLHLSLGLLPCPVRGLTFLLLFSRLFGLPHGLLLGQAFGLLLGPLLGLMLNFSLGFLLGQALNALLGQSLRLLLRLGLSLLLHLSFGLLLALLVDQSLSLLFCPTHNVPLRLLASFLLHGRLLGVLFSTLLRLIICPNLNLLFRKVLGFIPRTALSLHPSLLGLLCRLSRQLLLSKSSGLRPGQLLGGLPLLLLPRSLPVHLLLSCLMNQSLVLLFGRALYLLICSAPDLRLRSALRLLSRPVSELSLVLQLHLLFCMSIRLCLHLTCGRLLLLSLD